MIIMTLDFMSYQTTTYQIDTPQALWDRFSRLHDDRDRINHRVVELIAADVREQTEPADLAPAVVDDIEQILGATTPEVPDGV